MSNDGNGFSDMADYLGNLSRVDAKKVSLESLEKAANFYMDMLMPNIPRSLFKKRHMSNQVKVIVGEDDVRVVFGETAFYWRFAENGTSKQRAQHFASGTYEKYKDEIEKIMIQKIKQVWKG